MSLSALFTADRNMIPTYLRVCVFVCMCVWHRVLFLMTANFARFLRFWNQLNFPPFLCFWRPDTFSCYSGQTLNSFLSCLAELTLAAELHCMLPQALLAFLRRQQIFLNRAPLISNPGCLSSPALGLFLPLFDLSFRIPNILDSFATISFAARLFRVKLHFHLRSLES